MAGKQDRLQDSNINASSGGNKGQRGPAPRGECRFDGTDYPDWVPINLFRKAEDPFDFPFPEVEGDPWTKVAQMVTDLDEGMCNAWNEEIQNILLFSGLFSAVATAFAIETQTSLQPDPAVASVLLLAHLSSQLGNSSSVSTVNAIISPFQSTGDPIQPLRINVLIYLSLVLSLGTALVGIIALQWIRSYRSSEPLAPQDRISLRHTRYESLIKWKVPEIISALPIILQASLIIFFTGLIEFLHSLNTTITIIIAVVVGVLMSFVLFTMVAPGLTTVWRSFTKLSRSPYESPQSWLFVRFLFLLEEFYHAVSSAFTSLTRSFRSNFGQGHIRQPSYSPQGRRKVAANWVQLTRATYETTDTQLAYSLGWIIKRFTDVESFCYLFHCFQSLGWDRMQHTLASLSSDEYYLHTVWNTSVRLKPDPNRHRPQTGPVETKHLLSAVLIDWAQVRGYWTHSGITLYALELALRSTTYAIPPEKPGTRMEPWRLLLWNKIIRRCSSDSYIPAQSEMWLFGCLVYLRQYNILNAHERDPQLTFAMISRFVPSIESAVHRGTLNIVDDIFFTFENWMKDWQAKNPPEDVEILGDMGKKKILKHFMVKLYTDLLFRPNYALLQRPTFLSLLDHFAHHPNGQKSWKLCQNEAGEQDWGRLWDCFFVFTSLDTRYSTLLCDQDRVQRLVIERDRMREQEWGSAVPGQFQSPQEFQTHQMADIVDPDIDNNREDEVLNAGPNITETMTAQPHEVRNDVAVIGSGTVTARPMNPIT
ncbi:hypothetical protein BJ165DRAFT_1464190 [Panaeolus papilionaceus]|nr:hypothetical protein BJ165DRAFT_1464190 [Panaeolus papilionaceus]